MRLDIDEINDNFPGHFILDRVILVKNRCRWRPWQLVYIRLDLTLRIHFFQRSAMCFCAFSKVTATISVYIILPLVFLTETVSFSRYKLRLYM